MSKNKSNLPEGAFISTTGTNWGLDGFLFDGEGTGEGVLQGGRLPAAQGFSELPGNSLSEPGKFDNAPFGPRTLRSFEDGGDPGIWSWTDEEDDGFDLRTLMATDFSQSRLPNLDWLELETDLQKQDPNRLPVSPSDLSIAELSEAWGVDRRTNGLRLEGSNIDLNHARYFASLDKEETPRYRFTDRQVSDVVAQAARRSASGEPLRNILIETAQILGEEAHRAKQAMLSIKAEHGLAGRVFIRASIYPGCDQGNWNQYVPQSAQYVVASSKCMGCVHNKGGVCGMFQRRLVASVPWEQARQEYAPKFASAGVAVDNEGDPKEALRQAFTTPARLAPKETDFPVDHSHKYFRIDELMREAKADEATIAIAALRAREGDKTAQKVAKYLGECVRAGYITKDQAVALGQTGLHLKGLQNIVSLHIAKQQTKQGEFKGTMAEAFSGEERVPEMDHWQQEIHRVASVAGVKAREVTDMLHKIRLHLNDGWAGNRLDGLLTSHFGDGLLRAASHLIQATRTQHEGLAGHLYIEAATYGEKGVQGCEVGAQHHANNNIPYVLAMDKCGGCVFKNMHNTCTKYNRPLAGAFKDQDKKSFQASVIAQANAPVRTASQLAPVSNPVDEFNLFNNNLENIQFYKGAEDDGFDPQFDIQFDDGLTLY